MGNKEKLLKIHRKFLDSIKPEIEGEFLVGSLAYSQKKFIKKDSDLDIICIVNLKNLKNFLNTKYLKGLISLKDSKKILERGVSDYLVLKTKIGNNLLSIDVIPYLFFKKMCSINLVNRRKTYNSHKYGNLSQTNSYDIYNFSREQKMIKKESKKVFQGFSIKLPLFTISNGQYYDGIPTVKFLTSKIFFDPNKIISKNISQLYGNIINRIKFEKKVYSKKEIYNNLINIIKKRGSLSRAYIETIKNRINLNI